MQDPVPGSRPLFQSVDESGEADELAEMLVRQAAAYAAVRRGWYRLLGLRAGSFVVDCGSGLGEVAMDLAELVGPAGRVVGIDASTEMVESARRAARERALPVEFRVGDIVAIELADDAADAVYCERVMQWLPDPEAALQELIRVVHPGGRVLVVDTDHSSNSFAVGEDAEACERALRAYLLEMVPNPRIGSQLHRLFRRAGLIDIAFDVAAVPLSSFMLGWPFLENAVRHAVETGSLSVKRGDALVTTLQQDEAAGTFFGFALLIAVTATKARPEAR